MANLETSMIENLAAASDGSKGLNLEDYSISLRTLQGLSDLGIHTLDQVAEHTEAELTRTLIDKRAVEELRRLLISENLNFKEA